MVIRHKNLRTLGFDRSIRRIAEQEVAKVIPRVQGKLERELKTEMRLVYRDSFTAQELNGGNLQGELGIVDPAGKGAAIEEALADSVQIEVRQVRGGIRRFFPLLRIKTLTDDFTELLRLPEASQAWTDAKFSTVKGPPLPWLRWLLRDGTKTIIRGASLIRGKAGRSGLDYQMTSNNGRGTWKVPPEHAGTPRNNFLTRNLNARLPELRRRFTAIVNNAIRGLRSRGR